MANVLVSVFHRNRWLKWSLLVSCLSVFTPGIAVADKAEDARIEKAQDAVLEGRRALKEGRWMDGIWAYERAYSLFPQIEYLFTIASAYEKMPERCSDAVNAWERFVAVCGSCDDLKAGKLRMKRAKATCSRGQTKAASTPKPTTTVPKVDPTAAAAAAAAKAESYVAAQQYMKAVMEYERAFRGTKDAKYLFAVATTYEKIEDRCADAKLGWERFLQACTKCPQRAQGEARKKANDTRCESAVVPSVASKGMKPTESATAPKGTKPTESDVASKGTKPTESTAVLKVTKPTKSTTVAEVKKPTKSTTVAEVTKLKESTAAPEVTKPVEPEVATKETASDDTAGGRIEGVYLTAGMVHVMRDLEGGNAESSGQLFTIGGGFAFPINDNAALRTEATFRTGTLDFENSFHFAVETIHSVAIPIVVQLRLWSNGSIGVHGLVGAQADVLISGEVEDTVGQTLTPNDQVFPAVAVSVPAGLAFVFPIGGLQLSLDVGVAFGVSPWIQDESRTDIGFALRMGF